MLSLLLIGVLALPIVLPLTALVVVARLMRKRRIDALDDTKGRGT